MTTRRKILIFGAHSLIGEDVARALRTQHDLESHSRKDLDLTNIDDVNKVLSESEFDTVIYAAGLTDPEACEDEKEKAFFLNADIPGKIARYLGANKPAVKLVYFSDSMVFDGSHDAPYREADMANPQSVFGRSKLQGEKEISEAHANHIIVRTSWLFGKKMKGIFKKLLEIYQEKQELGVISNFSGNPTYARDVGRALLQLLDTNFSGIINIAPADGCTWFDYTLEFLTYFDSKAPERVHATTSDGSHLKSERPLNSRLDASFAQSLGIELPAWRTSLREYLADAFPKG